MSMLSVNTSMEIIVCRYKSDRVRLVDVTCVEGMSYLRRREVKENSGSYEDMVNCTFARDLYTK